MEMFRAADSVGLSPVGNEPETAAVAKDTSARAIGFVSPTGAGSLGDQAMIDAATAHVRGTLGRGALVYPHAPPLRSGATTISRGGRLGTLRATAAGLFRSGTAVYIGADVLDGVYSAKSSLKRLNALKMAHRLGRRTRVMGSSWSKTPAPEVIDFLKAAPWLDILARDPVSQARMERDLEREVRLVADLAFLLRPEADTDVAKSAIAWANDARAGGATVLAVNLSGHTVRTLPDQSVAPFAGLVSDWLDADPMRRVLVLPHDLRPGMGGDLTVCADLAKALRERHGDRIHEVVPPIDAWSAKAIAGAVDVVLTGRMHLAIAALGQGTPPVSIVYQGKFEGLMQHFGLEDADLTMAPDDIGAEAARRLAAATQNRDALGTRITAALPRITDLAASNFEGL